MKSSLRLFSLAFALLFTSFGGVGAQNVGIGTNSPDASAKLDISATDRGLLIPQVALGNVTNSSTPVNNPATGLLVWNTNASVTGGNGAGFYYWDGSSWTQLATGTGAAGTDWSTLGNAGTSVGTNFVGTTDNRALAFRTDNDEAMRIGTNGNIGIGSSSSSFRMYLNTPSSNNTARSLSINNLSSSNGSKYGIYNNVNDNGLGAHYGIYNDVEVNSSASSIGYGIYNALSAYGSTGDAYGMRNYIYTSGGSGDIYGTWTEVDDDNSGTHFGHYVNMESNDAYNSDNYANYALLDGDGDGNLFGAYNQFTASGTGTKYGSRNEYSDVPGEKYGTYNYWPNGATTGNIYGLRNQIYNDGSSAKYGVYNFMSSNAGSMNGSYNFLSPGGANSSTAYGVYSFVSSTGSGTHYGGYFYAFGDNNYAVYGSNSATNGWAGYMVGNVYADGAMVVNESGTVDHDLRVEGDTRSHLLFTDASLDQVRVGSVSDFGGRTSLLFDVDNGSNTGTEIGIGSMEYLTDGLAETTINNRFSPATDNAYDLGSATLRWQDIYAANGVIQTSDARAKTQIKGLEYGLDAVMKMRPVSYKWKRNLIGETVIPEEKKELRLGLIAQEVQKIVPEVVQTHTWEVADEANPGAYVHKENDKLGMRYDELIPVLIKAVQEQQEIIQVQEARIKALEEGATNRGK